MGVTRITPERGSDSSPVSSLQSNSDSDQSECVSINIAAHSQPTPDKPPTTIARTVKIRFLDELSPSEQQKYQDEQFKRQVERRAAVLLEQRQAAEEQQESSSAALLGTAPTSDAGGGASGSAEDATASSGGQNGGNNAAGGNSAGSKSEATRALLATLPRTVPIIKTASTAGDNNGVAAVGGQQQLSAESAEATAATASSSATMHRGNNSSGGIGDASSGGGSGQNNNNNSYRHPQQGGEGVSTTGNAGYHRQTQQQSFQQQQQLGNHNNNISPASVSGSNSSYSSSVVAGGGDVGGSQEARWNQHEGRHIERRQIIRTRTTDQLVRSESYYGYQNPAYDVDESTRRWRSNGRYQAWRGERRRIETASWRRFTVEQQIRYGIYPVLDDSGDLVDQQAVHQQPLDASQYLDANGTVAYSLVPPPASRPMANGNVPAVHGQHSLGYNQQANGVIGNGYQPQVGSTSMTELAQGQTLLYTAANNSNGTIPGVEFGEKVGVEGVEVDGDHPHQDYPKVPMAGLPMIGALMGMCIGGPVGFLAGVKIGGLAAVGGSILGYTGASVVSEHRELREYIDEHYQTKPELYVQTPRDDALNKRRTSRQLPDVPRPLQSALNRPGPNGYRVLPNRPPLLRANSNIDSGSRLAALNSASGYRHSGGNSNHSSHPSGRRLPRQSSFTSGSNSHYSGGGSAYWRHQSIAGGGSSSSASSAHSAFVNSSVPTADVHTYHRSAGQANRTGHRRQHSSGGGEDPAADAQRRSVMALIQAGQRKAAANQSSQRLAAAQSAANNQEGWSSANTYDYSGQSVAGSSLQSSGRSGASRTSQAGGPSVSSGAVAVSSSMGAVNPVSSSTGLTSYSVASASLSSEQAHHVSSAAVSSAAASVYTSQRGHPSITVSAAVGGNDTSLVSNFSHVGSGAFNGGSASTREQLLYLQRSTSLASSSDSSLARMQSSYQLGHPANYPSYSSASGTGQGGDTTGYRSVEPGLRFSDSRQRYLGHGTGGDPTGRTRAAIVGGTMDHRLSASAAANAGSGSVMFSSLPNLPDGLSISGNAYGGGVRRAPRM